MSPQELMNLKLWLDCGLLWTYIVDLMNINNYSSDSLIEMGEKVDSVCFLSDRGPWLEKVYCSI